MAPESTAILAWIFRILLAAAALGGVALVVVLVRREQRAGEIDPVTGHPLDVAKVPRIPNEVLARYGLTYCLFALVLALSVVAFLVWQPAIVALLAVSGVSNTWGNFLYPVALVLVGAGLFIAVLAAEYYLRKGVEQHVLGRRFAIVGAGLVGVAVVGWLLRTIATAALGA